MPPNAALDEMIEETIVDAYGPAEQITASHAVLEEEPALPFKTTVHGLEVTVTRLDLTPDEHVVAVCAHGHVRQRIRILDLRLPDLPPTAADWMTTRRRRALKSHR